MKRYVFKLFDYFLDRPLARDVLYWASFIVLVVCIRSLESWEYFGACIAGVFLYWGGLLQGGASAYDSLKDRP